MLRRIQKEIDDLSALDIPYTCEIKDLHTNKVITKFNDLRYHSVFITLFSGSNESMVIKIEFPQNYPFVPPVITISDPLYEWRKAPYHISNYNPCTTIVEIIKEFYTSLIVAVQTDYVSEQDEKMSKLLAFLKDNEDFLAKCRDSC